MSWKRGKRPSSLSVSFVRSFVSDNCCCCCFIRRRRRPPSIMREGETPVLSSSSPPHSSPRETHSKFKAHLGRKERGPSSVVILKGGAPPCCVLCFLLGFYLATSLLERERKWREGGWFCVCSMDYFSTMATLSSSSQPVLMTGTKFSS